MFSGEPFNLWSIRAGFLPCALVPYLARFAYNYVELLGRSALKAGRLAPPGAAVAPRRAGGGSCGPNSEVEW